jgi:5-(carboxyamino)imidazole ribonucleotide mutase
MGSRNDWETMQHAVARLEQLGVPCEVQVVSAIAPPTCFSAMPKRQAAAR